MEKPVYFTSKSHRSNYKRLLEKAAGNSTREIIAVCYTLAGIGTIEDDDQIEAIEELITSDKIDFDKMQDTIGINPSYRALVKLAANLYDSSYYANVSNTFSPLNDEYQAIVYQALLIKFPSFSTTFESRYYSKSN